MRTTIDLPHELHRTLKTRAAIGGVTVQDLVLRLIEEGLAPRQAPPPIIPATGTPIILVAADIHRLDEAEDLDRLARSLGR